MALAVSPKTTTSSAVESEAKSTSELNIVLIGDSVLDDFFWLKDRTQDVRQQIDSTLAAKKRSATVLNFAVDESTSQSVLKGKVPACVYSSARRSLGLAKYPVETEGVAKGKVLPLKLIGRMAAGGKAEHKAEASESLSETKARTYVICSVGGNDYRELILRGRHLSESKLMEAVGTLLVALERNVRAIVNALFDLGCVPVLVVCYEPYYQWMATSLPRESLLQMFDCGAQRLLSIAEQLSLAVLDLARTLDPFNREHYGSTSIEPSNLSGQFIADLVVAVVDDSEAAGHMFRLRNAGKSDEELVKTKIDASSKKQFTSDLLSRGRVETHSSFCCSTL